MSNIAIIYPNQLFEIQYLPYKITDIDCFIITEDPLFFNDSERVLHFNLLKLIYQRASMKYYQKYLLDKKSKVVYLDWQKNPAFIFQHIKKNFGTNNTIHLIDPVDKLLEDRLKKYSINQNIEWYDTPAFLLDNSELESYAESINKKSGSKTAKKSNRSYYQYSFYLWHRKHSDILLDSNGKPTGGKYSYDKFNRKSLPSNKTSQDLFKKIYPTIKKYQNKFYSEAISYCEATFNNYYPENYEPENIYLYPITHADIKNHFKSFLMNKLEYFGDYQDAIYFDENDNQKEEFSTGILFHSVISPQLNNGLITPAYVMKTVINYYEKSKIKTKILFAVEGFIRQLNWREYSRLLYKYAYNQIISKNYFKNNRYLTSEWYTGETGIEPIDQSIKFAFRYGYLHHIIRLMIMCNFMNLCEVSPHDSYKWFMEFSLDSYDWEATSTRFVYILLHLLNISIFNVYKLKYYLLYFLIPFIFATNIFITWRTSSTISFFGSFSSILFKIIICPSEYFFIILSIKSYPKRANLSL